MIVKTFKETYADKYTAISKLNFSESTFVYAVFNKEQKKKKKKKVKKMKKKI